MKKYIPMGSALAVTLLSLILSTTFNTWFNLGMIIAVGILVVSNAFRGERIRCLIASSDRAGQSIETERGDYTAKLSELNEKIYQLERQRDSKRDSAWGPVQSILSVVGRILDTPPQSMNGSWAARQREDLASAALQIALLMDIGENDRYHLPNSLWSSGCMSTVTNLLRAEHSASDPKDQFDSLLRWVGRLNDDWIDTLYKMVLVGYMHNMRKRCTKPDHLIGLDRDRLERVANDLMESFHHQNPPPEASFFHAHDIVWLDSLAIQHRQN
jgi:hypothetical protein